MKPDRSNYEIWFIDWLDGKLNESQISELKFFLEENPDLAEELEGLPKLELKPGEKGFRDKNILLKSTENYSESQFEYLCIAYLENDLNSDQSAELLEIINKDEDKKKIFDLVCRLRLTPENVRFPGKSSVKRLTIPQRLFRFASIGLSAAATIGILITGYFLLRRHTELKSDLVALSSINDTLFIRSAPVLKTAELKDIVRARTSGTKAVSIGISDTSHENSSVNYEPLLVQQARGSDSVNFEADLNIEKIQFTASISLSSFSLPNTIADYHPEIMPPTFDPYGRRSNVDRFFARIFHEKIMKDRSAGDRPVGSFELAEAGIMGLNKLLGWAMVLQQNPESSKDPKSYRFSSRLLKINTPVRKISDIM